MRVCVCVASFVFVLKKKYANIFFTSLKNPPTQLFFPSLNPEQAHTDYKYPSGIEIFEILRHHTLLHGHYKLFLFDNCSFFSPSMFPLYRVVMMYPDPPQEILPNCACVCILCNVCTIRRCCQLHNTFHIFLG